ncbi:Metastasis suppressor protein 1 [Papilio xuthus]|uniref:Metastasis suppressor protein 1 n=1 Tax=Papilio xuthus TaxID=66420 RepID=A0A0N0P9N9_PAPXU|nr:Metastasis suppressor protein 1 [Papilio xuthus]
MWEEFISKATKLHSALKSALVAIAAFLDAFQKIADAATNARALVAIAAFLDAFQKIADAATNARGK